MNSGAALSLDQVHVWRGDRHVLRGVSLQLRAGELLQISGPNGTGKTTLLRVMCGLLRPEQGRVSWCGEAITEIREQYQALLAYASHEPALKGDLTALENLRFSVGLKRRVSAGDLTAALACTGVEACADLPARVLSAGQRRRVAMARVLAMRARVWLLDEPFTNLDAAGAELITRLLREHVERGGLGAVVAHHALDGLRRLELQA
ncbi:MAG: cytochrome c biogenesis heme-transporting ATPase CcmA [Steroidobacteraceae bacterium]|jgi:heme exporter protein A